MLPRVGEGRRAGVYYNTGHGHLGWTLSAATAESIADTILSGSIRRAGTARAPQDASCVS
jgi:D-amino-acid dehydrogenase